ncbi:MAG: DUF4097 family beta strand repeat-containing protein [Acidobacteriaceae bacterium]
MKICPTKSLRQLTIALAGAALALSTTACTAARGSFNRTLQVSGPVTLRIATGSGNIHVISGDPGSVHVVGHIHAMGLFNAQSRVHQVESNPPIEQSGNNINIGGDTPSGVSIGYDITVPSSTQLTIHSGSGDLSIINIAGSTTADTGSGDIEADGLGGHVVIRTGSGDVHAGFENSNDIQISSGSGDLILRNAQGILVAHTGSGDITIDGTPSGGWNLKTGSGDVTLHTGPAHYSIDASTGSGDVHSELPITTHGNLGHHHLIGDVNGGGPTVKIVTGSGDIRID